MKQIKKKKINLTDCQLNALKVLNSNDNVFLTGHAGTGKSYLLSLYLMSKKNKEDVAVLASTGMAGILVGGTTFNSFFGLVTMNGGLKQIINRALRMVRVVARLKYAKEVIIDEISMISGDAIVAAEAIARRCRGNNQPWGGLRMIFVGDFSQLSPIGKDKEKIDWAFKTEPWVNSQIVPVVLGEVVRTENLHFLNVLEKIRVGLVDQEVKSFLKSRFLDLKVSQSFEGTRLFPYCKQVDSLNAYQLSILPGESKQFKTEYRGSVAHINKLKKHCPVKESIELKVGARVMTRFNCPTGKFVNGSQGIVRSIHPEIIMLDMLNGGIVNLSSHTFECRGHGDEILATATNFPISLAWAFTIHKVQGATLDRAAIDIRGLWAAGQAYVALTRVRSPKDLYITGWDPGSIIASPEVIAFHNEILKKV